MPVTPTYPGVYIEELPSAVRTIVGVSTSVTAFVGNGGGTAIVVRLASGAGASSVAVMGAGNAESFTVTAAEPGGRRGPLRAAGVDHGPRGRRGAAAHVPAARRVSG